MEEIRFEYRDGKAVRIVSDDEWTRAIEYLNFLIAEYKAIGYAGQFALCLTLEPLRARYNSGERTAELYDAIMECE